MRILTSLTTGLLLMIGTFITSAHTYACIPPPGSMMTSGFVARNHATLETRVSQRTLRENVRRGWKR